MIGWSIAAAQKSGCFDRIIVSTDDAEIAAVARELGAETPFVRPDALSDDFTGTTPVVAHAVEEIIAQTGPVDAVCCLYATAPFVRSADLRDGLDKLKQDEQADYVFTVTTYAFPPARALRMDTNGHVAMLNPENETSRSQDLVEVVHDAGQFYWGRPDAWREHRPIFGPRSKALVLPRHLVQDIDTPEDWERAEWMRRAMSAAAGESPA